MTAWSDDELEREIDALFAAEPSPQFLATVRSRMAEAPQRSRFPWVMPAFAGGAVLALLLVASRVWIEAPRALLPAERIDAALTARPSAPPPLEWGTPAIPLAPVAPRPDAERQRARRAVSPEVLVPLAEQHALQRVLRAAASEPLLMAQSAATEMHYPAQPPPPLVVPAIVIEPLVPEPTEEGDSK
jgi:hypothetical protein